jgi:dephospho-CoA kinase
MNKKVLALVGMCGAGKSVVTEYFTAKGFSSVYFGEATMDEIKRRGLEVNEKNEKAVREDLRKEHGMGAYAIMNIPKISEKLESENVIIDGLYSWSEYKVLKDKFGDGLTVLAVFTPKLVRYERLSKRLVRPLSSDDSQSRDYSEIENLEKGGPIAMADYTVINDGDIKSLHAQLDKVAV